ncbi:MAG: YheC/YheD family protein [Candidatus Marsarchaeota archaeon]|nr:YheC/YheD family protein [Candidatus Marsarchaeota archaeon]MCL5413302.1 YheC/YheD family protein [Candidatus Marsarchaeota archaeon]
MLNNPYKGKLGGFGLETYKERALIADRLGVTLVDVPISLKSLESLRRGVELPVRYWDGSSLRSKVVQVPSILVVYNYSGSGSSGTCNIGMRDSIIQEFRNIGKHFINGPEAEGICDDKSRSQTIFENAGVRCPTTASYTSANAETLFYSSDGLIFIKNPKGSEGRGQFTVFADGEGVSVVSIDRMHSFQRLCDALEYVSKHVDTSYLVQEGVRVQRINGSVFDIRAVFQIDGNGSIVLPAMYMRLGAAGSYQSNISSGGLAADPSTYGFKAVRQEIFDSGIKVFKELQRMPGGAGEIAMDFLISTEGKISILEINSLPGTKGIRDLAKTTEVDDVGQNWPAALSEVLRNPIKYSKYLINDLK